MELFDRQFHTQKWTLIDNLFKRKQLSVPLNFQEQECQMQGKLYIQEGAKLIEGVGKMYGHFLVWFDKKEKVLKGVYYVSGVKIGEIKDDISGKKGFYIQNCYGKERKL